MRPAMLMCLQIAEAARAYASSQPAQRVSVAHADHIAAAPSTFTASGRAFPHSGIRRQCVAVASASLAKMRARLADDSVLRRLPEHGVGRCLAHFRAVKQKRKMRRQGMMALLLHAVACGFKAHAM